MYETIDHWPSFAFIRNLFPLYHRQVVDFYPTCSHYGIEAVQKHGAIKVDT